MNSNTSPFNPFVFEASWQKQFAGECQKPYMLRLAAFIEREYAKGTPPVYPPKELIFNAFTLTPFDRVKVVMMGQDPYHGAGQAHGLCFSVPTGIKMPPSLQNIFKEMEADLKIPKPKHGCLISWAKQGVLLLNATLTVRDGEPLSHHGYDWELFTDEVIRKLEERIDPVIFVLWGKNAYDKCRFLCKEGIPSRHFILTAAHPSPLSAHNGFFGCSHFSKINDLLKQQNKEPIQWAIE